MKFGIWYKKIALYVRMMDHLVNILPSNFIPTPPPLSPNLN